MTAWVYTIVRNESLLMPYWLRHYRTFCDRTIVYDDESDDGTDRIAYLGGAEVHTYPGSGLDDMAMIELANAELRKARGKTDWVIWVDADEFVYHPQMVQILAAFKAEGVTLPMVEGYCMLADQMPQGDGQLYDEVRTGVRAPRYDKLCVVDPNLDLTWDVGRHDVLAPDAVRSAEPLKLLHYRWFGREYCEQRSARNYERLTQRNRDSRFGFETFPGYSGPYSPMWYEQQLAAASDVVSEAVVA